MSSSVTASAAAIAAPPAAPNASAPLPPPGSAAWEALVGRLHEALRRNDYSTILRIPTVRNMFGLALEPLNVWAFLSGKRRLMEQSAMPGFYARLLALTNQRVADLFAFFHMTERWPEPQARGLIREILDNAAFEPLLEHGILRRNADGTVECRLWFVPTGKLLLVSDPFDRTIPDFTFIGRDSLDMADDLRKLLRGRRFGRGLDLCSGTGCQALTIAEFAQNVMGLEINPRAVAYAGLNARLNGMGERATFKVNNLAQGVDGPFDIIVSNPPYVWMTEEEGKRNRDGYGGEMGLAIVRGIVAELDRLLSPTGEAHIVSDSPVMKGESALIRMVERELAGKKLGVTLRTVRFLYNRKRAAFLREHGVSHVTYYHMIVSRAQPPGVQIVPMSPLRWMAYSAYLGLAKRMY